MVSIYLFFILISFTFILPLVMVVSISFSSEASITAVGGGYSLLPKDFTLDAYKLAFANPKKVLQAYYITAAESFLGTFGTLLVCGMVSYALSRASFAYRGFVTFIIFFTMLFSAGMIPSYIINTKYYHLGNSFWIYVLPSLTGGAWYTLMMRTFFQGLPESLFESAKIDGAKEFTIFFRIALPLSKPVFATVGFMTLVTKWNDWNTSLVYIRDDNLYTLQYMLQKILNEADFMKKLLEMGNINISYEQIQQTMSAQPSETFKYALCVIAAGPMLLVFPFFQKYFVKGTTIGAVKG